MMESLGLREGIREERALSGPGCAHLSQEEKQIHSGVPGSRTTGTDLYSVLTSQEPDFRERTHGPGDGGAKARGPLRP